SLCLPRPPSPPLFPYTTLFRSGETCGHQIEDLSFAARQLRERHIHIPAGAGEEELHHAARDLRSEDDLTPADRFDRPRDIVLLRSEEHTSELQSRGHLVCRLLL